ncbi:DUF58 domain-containing protein [Leucobacter massiliensis]|uniref:Uncharacterized protein n=1 Tax=Leucobacter massiliensis TaxID=1686285 RepID=A0A2S9QMF5_9MICO|nr:DUF58 domain-containing protein [Leucobacter massiliensis]PRI10765.1 hypothetical protein B4915_07640 [Leucobacter massiliensis]
MSARPRRLRALPLSPTVAGAGLLGVAVAAGIGWGFAGLRDLLGLVALAAGALAVALLWLLLLRALLRPRAEMMSERRTPTAGEEVTVTATLWHGLPLAQRAELAWRGPEGSRELPVLLPRGAAARQSSGWLVRRRGAQLIAVEALLVTDPLGLLRLRIPLRASAELLVLPRPLPPERLPDELAGRGGVRGTSSGALAGAPSGGSGGAAAESSGGLREYRPGDPPRRVHWKQSARQDRLLVHEPERGAGERIATALLLDAEAYPGGAEDFECAVSLAAALVTRRAGTGRQDESPGRATDLCTVRAGAAGPRVERLGSSPSEALRALALAEPDGGGARGPADGPAAASAAPAVFAPTVIVTGAVTSAVAALAAASAAGVVVAVSERGAGGERTPGTRAPLPPGWKVLRPFPSGDPEPLAGDIDPARLAGAER